eukprot:NODE_2855_length_732_cov_311.989751_g2015_i0.p3 GENE.NODE_2855_length_732_cov_311.989751_g2015_i0~~NODE_2855_length_732_cov_311.989751_g2015_i0.p3  ORF type:complete len:181 (-),score=75.33 NODE_2855_length_732_cov_311.989751_g2015_i0:189-665(-)
MRSVVLVLLALFGCWGTFAGLAPYPCLEGTVQCDGHTKKICKGGYWENTLWACDCLAPAGKVGQTRCTLGDNLKCINGNWEIVGPCTCSDPAGAYGETRCVNAISHRCYNGRWNTDGPSKCGALGSYTSEAHYGEMRCTAEGKFLCTGCQWKHISTTC